MRRILVVLLIGSLQELICGPLMAASVTPIAGYIGSYSSNILRTSEDEHWEYINRPLLGFDVDHRGRSFNAYGHAAAEYFDYTQETADNETYFDINAIAQWNIVGNRFVWALEDYASITPLIISDPLTPFNIEQRNIFATGPTFTTRLGTRNQFDWSLRYADFYYQISDIDNRRVFSNIGIGRRINPSNNIRLGYDFARTDFKEEVYDNYNRHDVAVTYDLLGVTGNLTAILGYTYLNEDNTGDTASGLLVNFIGSKQVSRRSMINLIAGSGLSDTGLANLSFGASEVIPDVIVSPRLAFSVPSQDPTAEIFRESLARADYVHTLPTLISRFGIGYVQADYLREVSQDNKRAGLDLNFEYQVAVDSLLGVYLNAGRSEFPNLDVDTVVDNEGSLGANFTKILFRRVNLVFDVSRYVRNSNQPLRGYTDTILEVRLVYRPSGKRETIRRVRGR